MHDSEISDEEQTRLSNSEADFRDLIRDEVKNFDAVYLESVLRNKLGLVKETTPQYATSPLYKGINITLGIVMSYKKVMERNEQQNEGM